MTATPLDDLEKKATQAAQRAIVEARQATQLKHYGIVAKQLPLQLRQHGLGQVLVFLNARGKGRDSSPSTVLANQIQQHLADALPIGRGDLAALTALDSRLYLLATRQAEMFLKALMPLVEKFT